jgi:hypothetical protein
MAVRSAQNDRTGIFVLCFLPVYSGASELLLCAILSVRGLL